MYDADDIERLVFSARRLAEFRIQGQREGTLGWQRDAKHWADELCDELANLQVKDDTPMYFGRLVIDNPRSADHYELDGEREHSRKNRSTTRDTDTDAAGKHTSSVKIPVHVDAQQTRPLFCNDISRSIES